MGYPMYYARFKRRWDLNKDYIDAPYKHVADVDTKDWFKAMLGGDLKRLELDSVDDLHLKMYAEAAEITPEQAKKVLNKFFKDRI
jgi:hypothetical protein